MYDRPIKYTHILKFVRPMIVRSRRNPHHRNASHGGSVTYLLGCGHTVKHRASYKPSASGRMKCAACTAANLYGLRESLKQRRQTLEREIKAIDRRLLEL